MPKISIIVPVYQAEAYLRRCVGSILAQTFPDFELILVDDASPDRCGAICDEYAKADPRVLVIHLGQNSGVSASRNAGIDWAMANSSSEWITFIDSDDWVASIYLEALLEIADGYEIAVAACQRTTRGIFPIPLKTSFTVHPTEDFFCRNYTNAVVAWGKLYKKELFQTIRFPEGHIFEDTYTTHRILFSVPAVPVTTHTLYFYYNNPESITHKKWTPARLDEVDATYLQIDYFIRNQFLRIARERFNYLRWISDSSVRKIERCEDLSAAEKRRYIGRVRRIQRKALIRCRRYEWCSIRNGGDDLLFYSRAFPPLRIPHRIWKIVRYGEWR